MPFRKNFGPTQFTEWVLTLRHEDGAAIRALLFRTLIDDDLLSIAGLFWTQFCWGVTFQLTNWTWLAVPVGIDVLCFVLRWRIRSGQAPAEYEVEPRIGVIETLTVFLSILWMAVIATEVIILFRVDSLRTVALGIILPIGFLGYVSSLYAAFPRLAAINIGLLTTGLTIGFAASSFADLKVIAIPAPAAGLAYFVLMRRMHASLVGAIRAQVQNHERALHDPLTGLPNRTLMMDRLSRYCDNLGRADTIAPVGVLCLDLDGFKAVNDQHGHAAGDMVLVHVSKALRAAVRKEDTVSRLGGDEYVVVLPGADEAALSIVAERIITCVRQPIDIRSTAPVHVGVSVGIAQNRGERTTPEDLLARADAALYEAKRGGKGRYRLAA